MGEKGGSGREVELARDVISELVRTGIVVGEVLGSLLEDLSPDAFPGEDPGAVLLEMAAGSCVPVVGAAGEPLCREIIGLAGAIQDKFLADLRTAADLVASTNQES